MSLVPGPGWDQSALSPTYCVRVRTFTYLWGTNNWTENITFPSPLLLHVRNDLFGEDVELGVVTNTGIIGARLGTLFPGQCISLPIQGICGVYATCETQTTVSCVINIQQQ